ncbi:MAG TPA: acylglycerol kinase family protein, partial [Thermoleophilia bacterium]|nr:acylglycerol kinase family protein [Thermoleophilia bacterium]
MTDILLIVNPASDNGATRRRWPQLSRRLEALGVDFDHAMTAYSGHAAEMAENGFLQGYAVIGYVGGDGTANEVANGILALPPQERPQLAAIPCGTGGDFPRGLDLDRSLEAMAARLRRRRARTIDAVECAFVDRSGAATRRHFLNISDVGLGGRVAE